MAKIKPTQFNFLGLGKLTSLASEGNLLLLNTEPYARATFQLLLLLLPLAREDPRTANLTTDCLLMSFPSAVSRRPIYTHHPGVG